MILSRRRIQTACIALLSAATVGLLGACGSAVSPSNPRLPPASTPPERLTRIYLNAAKSGDCALTRKLTDGHHTWSWCTDPKLVAYRSVRQAAFVPESEAGRNEEEVEFEMNTIGSSDQTIPKGWQDWGLDFVYTPHGWRVYDQGQG